MTLPPPKPHPSPDKPRPRAGTHPPASGGVWVGVSPPRPRPDPAPAPPPTGGACLGLRLWLGGSPAWQGWLPPGDYLLGPPAPPGAPPRPGLLPRLLLLPPPESLPGGAPPALGRLLAGLRPGLLVASAGRGLFLRRRAGAEGVHCRAPHAPERGALPEGELVQAFDAQRFREGE